MAALPDDKVTPGKPLFTSVGIDYFGQFLVKRGRSLAKHYCVIFTSFAFCAVRIAIANTLDTESFINSVRRFIGRGGSQK